MHGTINPQNLHKLQLEQQLALGMAGGVGAMGALGISPAIPRQLAAGRPGHLGTRIPGRISSVAMGGGIGGGGAAGMGGMPNRGGSIASTGVKRRMNVFMYSAGESAGRI